MLHQQDWKKVIATIHQLKLKIGMHLYDMMIVAFARVLQESKKLRSNKHYR